MEFQEKNKVSVGLFSTGSTVEKFTPYYSMKGYRRADFLVAGRINVTGAGAAGATTIQQFVCRVMQASNSTGGGASAMSSATALVGKDSASGISVAMKSREGWINFGTLDKATALTITVGTAAYLSDSVSTAANTFPVLGSSLAATVAAQAFVTMFNAATNNTSTAITALWAASTEKAALPYVRIMPKDPDGTDLLHLGTTNSSMVSVGGVFEAHIGVDRQFMKDDKTHIALGIKSTSDEHPFVVTVIREKEQGPNKPVTYSKSMSQSTAK